MSDTSNQYGWPHPVFSAQPNIPAPQYPTAPQQGLLGTLLKPADLVSMALTGKPAKDSVLSALLGNSSPQPAKPAAAPDVTPSQAQMPTTRTASQWQPLDITTAQNSKDIDGNYLRWLMRTENQPLANAIAAGRETPIKAYDDGQQWSIGFGTKATPGMTYNSQQAVDALREEAGKAFNNVDKWANKANVQLSQQQRTALADLTYNAGPKWQSGKIGMALRSGNVDAAANALRDNYRVTSKGTVQPGLISRRNWQADMLQGPASATSAAAPAATNPAPKVSDPLPSPQASDEQRAMQLRQDMADRGYFPPEQQTSVLPAFDPRNLTIPSGVLTGY